MKPHVKYMIICQEKHQDEGLHLHAVISFSKKVDIRDCTFFDINGFHPKIEPVKSLAKSVNYVKKDGVFIEYGERETHYTEEKVFPVYEPGMTKLEWMTACFKQKIPYGYTLALWAELCPASTFSTLLEYDKEAHSSRISHVKLQLMVPILDHLKSYVIVGPSGCGKTTWAKIHCLKPALMVTHMDDLKNFKIGFHMSIIFDDMTFTHLDPVLQIPIADRYDNRSVHCRYNCALIPSGIQKIFTCNVIPFSTTVPQIARRINLINLF